MLKLLRYILSALGFFLALYGLISNDFRIGPIMLLCLGLMFLVMGLEEFKKRKKAQGWLMVSIKGFRWI
ncbi:DUF3953 domain-containing protein [Radiobacillus deserti]|uniref:DUF3953 domain-containing protein n=1 Tax=Radiobacillus deserti TaxID=2594883 RepID=A0A516KE66_9BACI|nr:DUF3953 domain-containing protein [Radiobacillus deserti]